MNFMKYALLILGLVWLSSDVFSADLDNQDPTSILNRLCQKISGWQQNCPDERHPLNRTSVEAYIADVGSLYRACLATDYLNVLFQTHLGHWLEKNTEGQYVMLSGGRLNIDQESQSIARMLAGVNLPHPRAPSFFGGILSGVKEMLALVSIAIGASKIYPY